MFKKRSFEFNKLSSNNKKIKSDNIEIDNNNINYSEEYNINNNMNCDEKYNMKYNTNYDINNNTNYDKYLYKLTNIFETINELTNCIIRLEKKIDKIEQFILENNSYPKFNNRCSYIN
jgi:hypothetical protein